MKDDKYRPETEHDEAPETEAESLPDVAGRMMTVTISEIIRRCHLRLADEQRAASPDNYLISILCETIRLAREYTDFMKEP